MKYPFPHEIKIKWSEEDEAYIASVPDIPGCVAHGVSIAAATVEVRQAAEALKKSQYSGKLLLRMSPELHERLVDRAHVEDRSLNKTILRLLEKALQE